MRGLFQTQKREDAKTVAQVSPTHWLEEAKAWNPYQSAATEENFVELIASWSAQVCTLRSRRDRLDAALVFRYAAVELSRLTYRDLGSICFSECRKLLRELLLEDPADSEVLLELAGCENLNGIICYEGKKLSEAQAHYQLAISLRRDLTTHPVEKNLQDANYLYLGGALCNLGNVKLDLREIDDAQSIYAESIDLLDSLIPGCDCGCRTMFAKQAFEVNGFSLVASATQFLGNALSGRDNTKKLDPRMTEYISVSEVITAENGPCTRISFLAERLDAEADYARALKHDALFAVARAKGAVELDVSAVRHMSESGVALLHHLRLRLIGEEIWPTLHLTNEQRVQSHLLDCIAKFES